MLKEMARALARGEIGLRAPLRCSFCHRHADDVERLVAGASAYICDACIARCVAILETHGGFGPSGANH
jgi:hypothetical protein